MISLYSPNAKLLLVKNPNQIFECSINDLLTPSASQSNSNRNDRPSHNQEQHSIKRQPNVQVPVDHYVSQPQNQYRNTQYTQYVPNNQYSFYRNFF